MKTVWPVSSCARWRPKIIYVESCELFCSCSSSSSSFGPAHKCKLGSLLRVLRPARLFAPCVFACQQTPSRGRPPGMSAHQFGQRSSAC